MKVLICATAYPPDIRGGGEISTQVLAEGLKDLGVDVSVLTFTDDTPVIESVRSVPVQRIACSNNYWSLRSASQSAFAKARWHFGQAFRSQVDLKIIKAVRELSPDVIHTSTIEDFGPGFWRWAKHEKLRTVHTLRSHCLLHRSANLYDARRDRPLRPDLLSIPKRSRSHYVDGVVGISDDILKRHQRYGFFSNSISDVIGNSVHESPASIRSRPLTGPVRLGILGRLSSEKGIEHFLRSLHTWDSPQDWRLQIAGRGEDSFVEQLRSVAKGLPVDFVGWQDSQEFLTQQDLLVIPSRCYEAFGRGVIEANQVGVPVLSLRRGGLPELIVQGKNGWVVEQWDQQSISTAVEGCRLLSPVDVAVYSAPFTADKIARRYVSFYNRVVETSKQ